MPCNPRSRFVECLDITIAAGTATNTAVVTFAGSFASAPTVQVSSSNGDLIASWESVLTTGFTARLTSSVPLAPGVSITATVSWVADSGTGSIGPTGPTGATGATGAMGGVGNVVPVAFAVGSGSGNYSVTASGWTVIDGSGLSVTIAAAAGDVVCSTFQHPLLPPGAGCFMTFDVGGTKLGDADGLVYAYNNVWIPTTLVAYHVVASGEISGGNVTIEPYWKVASGTAQIENVSGNVTPSLYVANLLH